MPWGVWGGAAALVVLSAAWVLRRRRTRSGSGPLPDVGQPPAAATPLTEPQLDDTGLGAYSLPLSASDDEDAE